MEVELLRVPKPGARAPGRDPLRSLAVPSPRLARAYEGAVAPLVGTVEATLGRGALAHRPRNLVPTVHRIELAPWRPARDRFEHGARQLAGRAVAVAVADVRACYGSIAPEVVEARLRTIGAPAAAVLRVLERFERAGVVGLPIGPAASPVLANLVLARVDDAIRAAGVRHLRWVDDLVIGGRTASAMRRALARVEESLGELGLTPAREKTGELDPARIRSRPDRWACGSDAGGSAVRCVPSPGTAPL